MAIRSSQSAFNPLLASGIQKISYLKEPADLLSELPITGNTVGDTRFVLADNKAYVRDGVTWNTAGTSSSGALTNYLGLWNATTNTPTILSSALLTQSLGNRDSATNTPALVSSTGTEGDWYRVSVASSGVTTLDTISVWAVDDIVYFHLGVWNKYTDGYNQIGTLGDWYKVGTAGTTSIDGIAVWNVGDYIWFDGTSRQKIDNQAGSSSTFFNVVANTNISSIHFNGVIQTAGNITLTLPTAVGITNSKVTIIKGDTALNTLTLATTSSQTVAGELFTYINAQYTSFTVISDGANWKIL